MSIDLKFRVDRGSFALEVELSVPAQGVTAVFGPSGCGKTTLLRAIAGLERHAGGYMRMDGVTWQDAEVFVPPHRRPLGYVFQEASLFTHLSVRQNLEYGVKRLAQSERRVSLEQSIELLRIGDLLSRRPGSLSGGERQRVAIARALAVSPRLLLMDEPLAALDRARKREIMPYVESLCSELDIPVLYVSHAAREVARVADHLVLLEAGRVQAEGGIGEILTRFDLPLAIGNDAEAVIDATVDGHDDTYDLTYLNFPGGRFAVVRQDLPFGETVRLRIAARDVSLTLEHQSNTSILNIFPAIVDELTNESRAQITVRVLVGGIPMLARVTRKSADLLQLKPGSRVYAQAKSVALLS